MKQDELVVLFLWYQSNDQAEIDCFNENLNTYKNSNPDVDVICVESSAKNYSDSYSSIDITLIQWYGAHKHSLDYKRFLLVHCASWCDVSLKDYYKGVWDLDVASPSVLYPERDSWHWFDTINKIPVRARVFATGISPFCGIFVSKKAMEEILQEIVNIDYVDLESELRFATIATMLGYDPVPIPITSRSMNWNEKIPFNHRYKGLHFPRKKLANDQCLNDIEKYFKSSNKEVPKIFHQTWKTDNIPEAFQSASLSWRDMHPDWNFILWTDEMNRKFIETYFYDFLLIYDSYLHPIQQVDAVRYFILFKMGGVFIDIDFECLQNIEPLVYPFGCSFGLEPALHAKQKEMDFLICNAFMAACINDDFLKYVIERLYLYNFKRGNYFYDVLESTGPLFLTKIYSSYCYKDKVNIIPSKKLYPLTAQEAEKIRQNKIDQEIIDKLDGAYALHHFSATWITW